MVLLNRECGALEASDTSLGIPLYGTDPRTTIRWLDINIYRNPRVKFKGIWWCLKPTLMTFIMNPGLKITILTVQNLWKISTCTISQKYMIYLKHDQFLQMLNIIVRRLPEISENKRAKLFINHYFYDVEQVSEEYAFSLLLMFKP